MKAFFCCGISVLLLFALVNAKVIDFEVDSGAKADDDSLSTAWSNGGLLNSTLASLQPYDILVFPNKTFHLMGGIQASGLNSVTLQFDGTVVFSNDLKEWPTSDGEKVLMCMHFSNFVNVSITSSGTAVFDGQGSKWWGVPGIGYLVRGENRPRLIQIDDSKDILVEHIIWKNSPYWTFLASNVDGLEVRFSDISARRTDNDGHNLIDITAFNTDGFDVTGKNVWIHDCNIWNQDDTIAVKDGSENMLFERIHASGIGLTIGSIGGGSVVRNITFRDCTMHHTYKGIYMKFRSGGSVSDVTYENIVMDEPSQWPIWIGPAQQSDSSNLCAAHPCSICWPTVPFTKCNPPVDGIYSNILLKNITINNPKMSAGVVLADVAGPMQGVEFRDVVVNNPAKKPWGDDHYKCEGVNNGVATGTTWPVPPCFEDRTDATLATTAAAAAAGL